MVDVERAAELGLEALHGRLLGVEAADLGAGAGPEEHAAEGLGRGQRGGRGGRLGRRFAAGVVAPEGEAGTDDGHGEDDGDREAGAGGEEVPEPAGRC